MKSIIKPLFILAIMALSVFSYAQEPEQSQESTTYVENEFIIWLEQDVDAADFAAKSNTGIMPKRQLSKRLNIWLFEINDNKELREDKMRRLNANADVRVIQNNHTNITLREAIPDDPYYYQQWAPAIMNLPQAWEEFTTGGVTATGDTIVVAVIDGGADWTHEDLNCWENAHEIPNNGIDDDGNGYIDDFHGWNAYNHNGYVGSNNHGTHVSGIIGAVGNNGKGVCGVNWNVKVMPIGGSSSNESIVVEAYSYVLEMRARYNETDGEEGAFIVATNSSFGVDYGNPDDYPIWCSMYDEMGNVGILSCGAGPNLNVNVDVVGDVPSACPGNYLIGITNTTSDDVKYTGAGYGINNIDIGAPGTSIYSTLPNNNYGNMTGTSMATPQVSGTIALMYAALPEEMMIACKNDPANFCLSVRHHLLNGADHLPSLDGLVASGRRLNAYGAIESVLYDSIIPTLTGEVNISGEPFFGETLTAETNLGSMPSIPDLGELHYQWRRDTTAIEGAVYSTYTLTEDDIFEKVCVQVTAENCTGAITSPLFGPIKKAEQPMPEAPQMESNTDTSITLVAIEDGEYSINGSDWQPSPVFEGLMPSTSYIFTQRKKETRSHYASPVSPEAVYCTMPYDYLCENHRNTFKVYPNPAKGYIIIEGTGNMTVTNALGQTILTKEIKGKEKLVLPQGMYFVTLGSETRKIVVE
ncbi:MAG: peptidase S8 and S53 subtilisin kexin sedolisin [bacterium F082]|nr:MAG: peptidase S8 and S53 subtilisin kexin sedolisin [bacterium F082]KWW31811.1 MAG: peptidase S8 and S53 subtilisin kexin sedolisin [bacterium P201]